MKNELISIFTLIAIMISTPAVFADSVSDTGQVRCYDNSKQIPCPEPGAAFFGQDGNYTTSPHSYTSWMPKGMIYPIQQRIGRR